jgi:hypothetical protein
MVALSELTDLPVYKELNNKTISLTNTLCLLLGEILNTVKDKLEIDGSYQKTFNSFSMLEKVNLVVNCANHINSYLGEDLGNKTVIGALSRNLSKQLEASKNHQIPAKS